MKIGEVGTEFSHVDGRTDWKVDRQNSGIFNIIDKTQWTNQKAILSTNVSAFVDLLLMMWNNKWGSFQATELIRWKLSLINSLFNLLNPTGHVMHQQFNIQQFYVLPTMYLCVFYLSENKQRLLPLTA